MTESKRRHSLNGTVLIMILTVMAMLIVILMTTLTVVTAANQRIYTKYEENQAYYSARSALDIFTGQIIRDDGYYAFGSGGSRSYTYRKEDGTTGTAIMKQGLAMEFEFYKIVAKNEYAGIASNSVYGSAQAFPNDPEKTNYSSEDATAANPMSSITYTVKFPTVSNNASNNYGKLADVDSATGYSEATIKVEVERRIYNFGGPYASVFSDIVAYDEAHLNDTGYVPYLKSLSAPSATINYNGNNYTFADLQGAIQQGAREKDEIRLKVTSTTEFNGTQGQAVIYIDTTEKPKVNSSRAITSMGGIGSSIGAFAFGGASSLSSMTLVNNGTLVGDLYVNGDFNLDSGAGYIYLLSDTVYAITGDFTTDGGKAYQNQFKIEKNGSLLYVGGTMTFNSQAGNWGSATIQPNVLAGTLTFSSTALNGSTYYGNMYSNVFIPQDISTATMNANIYTNYADLTPSGDLLNADGSGSVNLAMGCTDTVVVDGVSGGLIHTLNFGPFFNQWGTVQIGKGFILPYQDGSGTGLYELVAADTLQITDTSSPYYGEKYMIDVASPVPTIPGSKTVDYNYFDPNEYTMTSEMKKKFELVASLAGTSRNTVELPTAQSLYSEILKTNAFVNDSPDQGHNGDIDTNAPSYPTFSGTVSAAGITLQRYEWDPSSVQGAVHPENIDGIAKGIITDENCSSYGYMNQWDSDWAWDKKIAAIAFEQAKASDAAYQQALADYYAIYITGAEKAGAEVDTRVMIPGLSEVTLEPISAYSGDAELTQAASDIGASSTAKVISSSGYLRAVNSGIGSDTPYGAASQSLTPDLTNPVIIDARTNAINIQLGDGTGSSGNNFAGAFIVVGDQPVKILLPDGLEEYTLGTTDGRSFFVSTLDIYKELKKAGGGTLRLGTDANAMPSPKVYLYAGDNVKKVKIAHKACFLAAHVYIPFAEYDAENNAGIAIQNMTYDGVPINWQAGHSDVGFTVIGSLICGNYKTGSSGVAVAYISPDAADYTPGDPIFSWSVNRYARN